MTRPRAPRPRKPKAVEAWAGVNADGFLCLQTVEMIPIIRPRTYHKAIHLFPDAAAVLAYHDRGGVTPIRVTITPARSKP